MKCKICSGPLYLLGKLGNVLNYRCRNCGMEWHRQAIKGRPK